MGSVVFLGCNCFWENINWDDWFCCLGRSMGGYFKVRNGNGKGIYIREFR